MKKTLKVLSILMVVALIVSVFSACNQGETTPTDSTKVQNTSKPNEDKETEDNSTEPEIKHFSILQPLTPNYPADVDTNNNVVTEVLKRELPNIDIEWIMVPGNALGEKKTLLMNSGEFPDVVPANDAEMINWANQGMLQPLDDVFEEHYPNIRNFLDDNELVAGKYNGHTYGILSPVNPLENPRLTYYRADWLENLGMDAPETLDDLYKVLHAMTFDDPDKNGKDDTFGVCISKDFYIANNLLAPFGVFNNHWSKIDGQIIPDIIRPEMKEALTFMNKLYTDGIMDKDSLVSSFEQVKEKFLSEKLGFINYGTWNMNAFVINDLKKINADSEVMTLTPIPAADGKRYVERGRKTGGFGGNRRVVTIECKHPDAVLDFFNWIIELDDSVAPAFSLNSDKFYFGPNRDCLKLVGDKYYSTIGISELTPEKQVLRALCTSYRFHWGSWQNLDDENMIALAEAQVKEGVMHNLTPNDKKMASEYFHASDMKINATVYAEKWSDIQTYWNEIRVGILTGTLPIDEFDKWVEFFYDNGGQEIIDEVTEMNS
jgi:putative aldouronate transport system substrate-binding protein